MKQQQEYETDVRIRVTKDGKEFHVFATEGSGIVEQVVVVENKRNGYCYSIFSDKSSEHDPTYPDKPEAVDELLKSLVRVLAVVDEDPGPWHWGSE